MCEKHVHPISGDVVLGRKLSPGERLESSDVYASNIQGWKICPKGFAGIPIPEGGQTIWVRPPIK